MCWTWIGADAMCLMRLKTGFGLTGIYAVVGTTLGADASTLVILVVMDRVVHISVVSLLVPTLRTGCILGTVCFISASGPSCWVSSQFLDRCWMSRMSSPASMLSIPVVALEQSACAFRIVVGGYSWIGCIVVLKLHCVAEPVAYCVFGVTLVCAVMFR